MYEESIHAFLFTYCGQGHVNPTLEFAYLLVANGLSVTYVSSDSTISGIKVQQQHCRPALRMVGLPDGLPPQHQRTPFNYEFHRSCYAMEGQAEKLVEDTLLSEKPLAASTHIIISDTFCPWTSKVAKKFGLRWIPLWVASFYSFYIAYHLPTLIERGYVPAIGCEMTEIVDCLVDLPEFRVSDLPFVFTDPSTPTWFIEFLVEITQSFKDAPVLLGNNFEELECDMIRRLRHIYPSVYPVGPLLPQSYFSNQDYISSSSSRCEGKEKKCMELLDISSSRCGGEEKKCMEWLEAQRAGSVLYIAFGSIAELPPDQLRILAQGILASGQPFLWVIRDMSNPFLDSELHHHGIIVSWAPQVHVLHHPSIGGFLTHCGWSSTMEAVCAGVPLIAWPQIGEQNTNAKFIAEVWKVGIRLPLNEDGKTLKGSTVVSECIAQLFDEGSALRLAMSDFSCQCKKALGKGGSPDSNLISFIRSLRMK